MSDAFTPEDNDPVADLVGEGKKFATVADLAKGKAEADAFIERLKTEAADLRKELGNKVDTEKTLEDLRNELKALKDNPAPKPPDNTRPSVSEADLKSLIAKTITEQEASKTSTQNIVTANNAVVKHYGTVEKAQEALKAKAKELNLTIDELKNTAAKSPTAFIKLVLPEAEQKAASDFISGSIRSEALPHTQGGGPKEGTKEHFDKIRKDNPKLYWSPKIQSEIYKAAQAGTYDYNVGLDRS